ncbi:MAG: hypothetical protein JXA30_13680 [Deltaproteobacteria bacterium]|nr:hypothetical protein [Deltaproteobacteria bacterium]
MALYLRSASEYKTSETKVSKEVQYLSRTPERAAEGFLAALTRNDIKLALALSRGKARQKVLDGTIIDDLADYWPKPLELPGGESVNSLSVENRTDLRNKPRALTAPTRRGETVRGRKRYDKPEKGQKPVLHEPSLKAEPRTANTRERLREPLLLVVQESHRNATDRLILKGAIESNNARRVRLGEVEMEVIRRGQRWYVAGVRFGPLTER